MPEESALDFGVPPPTPPEVDLITQWLIAELPRRPKYRRGDWNWGHAHYSGNLEVEKDLHLKIISKHREKYWRYIKLGCVWVGEMCWFIWRFIWQHFCVKFYRHFNQVSFFKIKIYNFKIYTGHYRTLFMVLKVHLGAIRIIARFGKAKISIQMVPFQEIMT